MEAVFRRIRTITDIAHRPWMWFAFSIFVLTVDFLKGPYLQFPITYIIPVSISAWHRGLRWALPFAIILPLIRFSFSFIWLVPWTVGEAIINLFIRVTVLVSFALLVNRTARQTRELEKEVKLLKGILPICGHCKKIRDDKGSWQQMESYITRKSEAQFSHTCCPACAQEHWGEYLK